MTKLNFLTVITGQSLRFGTLLYILKYDMYFKLWVSWCPHPPVSLSLLPQVYQFIRKNLPFYTSLVEPKVYHFLSFSIFKHKILSKISRKSHLLLPCLFSLPFLTLSSWFFVQTTRFSRLDHNFSSFKNHLTLRFFYKRSYLWVGLLI